MVQYIVHNPNDKLFWVFPTEHEFEGGAVM